MESKSILHQGKKEVLKTKRNADIWIIDHHETVCFEIIAHEAGAGLEPSRIYLKKETIMAGMKATLFGDRFAIESEQLVRQRRNVANDMVVQYILSRIQIQEKDGRYLTIEILSSGLAVDSALMDASIPKPAKSVPFKIKNIQNNEALMENTGGFMNDTLSSSNKINTKSSTKQKSLTVNISNCQYTVLSKACKTIGWKTSYNDPETENWDVYWCDSGLGIEQNIRITKSFQRVNHFPGMVLIYRKNQLANSIAKMQRICLSEYDFVPKTWSLPQDLQQIMKYLHARKDNCVIIKPVAGAQGRGISLAMASNFNPDTTPHETCIVQSYISRPLLLDGYKFDMRIYVLVTSCEPLRVLLYKEGLCRLCTTPYNTPNTENLDCTFMHLTNYSVNKHNENFIQNDNSSNNSNSNDYSEDFASKRSLTWLWHWLGSQGHDVAIIWNQIADIVVKTLISVQAPLSYAQANCKLDGQNKNPFTCFELLGFDIMLTQDLVPVLIEVNHMPSFKTDSALDLAIKQPLIENTLSLLNVTASERHRYISAKQLSSQMRLYGDLFDSNSRAGNSYSGSNVGSCNSNSISNSKKNMKDVTVHDTSVEYWKRYLKNERRNIGNFQLVYPTDCYAHQPTKGRQQLYDWLISQAASVFAASQYGIGSNNSGNSGNNSRSNSRSNLFSTDDLDPYNKSTTKRMQLNRNIGIINSNSNTNSNSSSFATLPDYQQQQHSNHSNLSSYFNNSTSANSNSINSNTNSSNASTGNNSSKNATNNRADYVQRVIDRSNHILATITKQLVPEHSPKADPVAATNTATVTTIANNSKGTNNIEPTTIANSTVKNNNFLSNTTASENNSKHSNNNDVSIEQLLQESREMLKSIQQRTNNHSSHPVDNSSDKNKEVNREMSENSNKNNLSISTEINSNNITRSANNDIISNNNSNNSNGNNNGNNKRNNNTSSTSNNTNNNNNIDTKDIISKLQSPLSPTRQTTNHHLITPITTTTQHVNHNNVNTISNHNNNSNINNSNNGGNDIAHNTANNSTTKQLSPLTPTHKPVKPATENSNSPIRRGANHQKHRVLSNSESEFQTFLCEGGAGEGHEVANIGTVVTTVSVVDDISDSQVAGKTNAITNSAHNSSAHKNSSDILGSELDHRSLLDSISETLASINGLTMQQTTIEKQQNFNCNSSIISTNKSNNNSIIHNSGGYNNETNNNFSRLYADRSKYLLSEFVDEDQLELSTIAATISLTSALHNSENSSNSSHNSSINNHSINSDFNNNYSNNYTNNYLFTQSSQNIATESLIIDSLLNSSHDYLSPQTNEQHVMTEERVGFKTDLVSAYSTNTEKAVIAATTFGAAAAVSTDLTVNNDYSNDKNNQISKEIAMYSALHDELSTVSDKLLQLSAIRGTIRHNDSNGNNGNNNSDQSPDYSSDYPYHERDDGQVVESSNSGLSSATTASFQEHYKRYRQQYLSNYHLSTAGK